MSSNQIHSLGIDVGSTTAKIVAIDESGQIIWYLVEQTEPLIEKQVQKLLGEATKFDSSATSAPLGATGYGRKLVNQADHHVTEIKCHALGAFRDMGHGGTLIDIGGQDSKVITIDTKGGVTNFVMNDKCAAGTGRFLENTAARLRIPIEEMGKIALSTTKEVPISSTCVVFAESEIISLIAHGTPIDQIVRGVHYSLIARVTSLVRSCGPPSCAILSGGVARNPAISALLEEKLSIEIGLPRLPQLMGAYGAALVAMK